MQQPPEPTYIYIVRSGSVRAYAAGSVIRAYRPPVLRVRSVPRPHIPVGVCVCAVPSSVAVTSLDSQWTAGLDSQWTAGRAHNELLSN